MADWVRVGSTAIASGEAGCIVHAREHELALFRVGEEYRAIENRCPHQGASLALGTRNEMVVTCPWHSWQFDLTTGAVVGRMGTGVRSFPVRVEGDDIFVDVADADVPATNGDGIHRYLVRYGALAWVGWFGSIETIECTHRDRVVIHTSRGLELGEILAAPGDPGAKGRREQPAGEVLRRADAVEVDEFRARYAEPMELLEEARTRIAAAELSLELVDCERLFDEETVVLYYLGDSPVELGTIATRLSEEHALRVLFQPVIDPPPGGGGCGGGGGGCHSGGCSH
jgi:nitrite reductase/ring-hydroxylating ferredoxin subunit